MLALVSVKWESPPMAPTWEAMIVVCKSSESLSDNARKIEPGLVAAYSGFGRHVALDHSFPGK